MAEKQNTLTRKAAMQKGLKDSSINQDFRPLSKIQMQFAGGPLNPEIKLLAQDVVSFGS